MLLAIDVGNTNMVFGLYDGDKLRGSFRISTNSERTSDELVKMAVPVVVPIPLSLYFDVFDGMIQAIVFVFLTTLFLSESLE